MAGRLFGFGSDASRFALHRLAAARGRFPVIHACSRANRHLAPPSFFLLHQGSVGSGIRLWICGLVTSANSTRFGKTSIGGQRPETAWRGKRLLISNPPCPTRHEAILAVDSVPIELTG